VRIRAKSMRSIRVIARRNYSHQICERLIGLKCQISLDFTHSEDLKIKGVQDPGGMNHLWSSNIVRTRVMRSHIPTLEHFGGTKGKVCEVLRPLENRSF
jgi:hypothetical protein